MVQLVWLCLIDLQLLECCFFCVSSFFNPLQINWHVDLEVARVTNERWFDFQLGGSVDFFP